MDATKAPRQKTGGRQAGTPNRHSRIIRHAAAEHAVDAVAALVRLMMDGESDAIKLAACRELLDRAGGKTVDAEIVSRFESNEINASRPKETLDEALARGF